MKDLIGMDSNFPKQYILDIKWATKYTNYLKGKF